MKEDTERSGFSVREMGTGNEVDFIPTQKMGTMRERALMGLLRHMDTDRFYVVDTEDEE